MAAERPKGVSGGVEASASGTSESGRAPFPLGDFGASHHAGQKAKQQQFPMHEEDHAGTWSSGFRTPQGEFDESHKEEELHSEEDSRAGGRERGGAEEVGGDAGPSQDLQRSGSTLGVDEEFQGPDTSSLAAFLLSLINLNPRKLSTPMSLSGSSSYSEFVSEYGDSEDEEGEELGPQHEEEGPSEGEADAGGRAEPLAREAAGPGEGGREGEAAQSYAQGAHSSAHVQGPGIRRRVARGEGEGERAVESSRGGHGAREDSHAREPEPTHLGPLSHPRRWLMVRLGFTSEATPSKASSGHGAEQLRSGQSGAAGALPEAATRGRPTGAGAAHSPAAPPGADAPGRRFHSLSPSDRGGPMSPSSPQRLPALSEESLLLTDDMRQGICAALPALSQGREWVLLYSTARHGISLHTLYRKSAMLPGPCVLVVGEKGGCVFGGYASCSLQESNRCKYQGTSDTFVFSDLSGAPEVFRASGANRYFVLCSSNSLAFGGGGHFAFRLEEDLLSGTTGECETFRSPQLAKSEDFNISHVELWGFAHTSRYAPPSTSTWQETHALGADFHSAW